MMEASLTPSVKLQRTACDHCRHHKLKCDRESGQIECRRCLRAHEPCTTGAARKAGRPSTRREPSLSVESPNRPERTNLATPPGSTSSVSDSYGPDRAHSNVAANNNSHGALPRVQGKYDSVAQIERRSHCMKRLGELHVNLHVDVDVIRCAQNADRCKHGDQMTDTDTPPSFFISRLFNHGKALLEISDHFDLHDQQHGSEEKLSSDVPTIMSLLSCYVTLTRLFRIILSVIHTSVSMLLKSPQEFKYGDLFEGLSIGDYSLESRLDLQLLFVVHTAEDMIAKLETAFGVRDLMSIDGCDRQATLPRSRTSELLLLLLKQEADEQPPMDRPREHFGTLHEVVRDLKLSLQPR